MALPYRDLASLVRAMADKYHDGVILSMSKRTGLAPATLDKWVKANVRNPELESLALFARGCDLDLQDVIDVVRRGQGRGRKLASLLLIAGILYASGGVPAHAGTLQVGAITRPMPLIRTVVKSLIRALSRLLHRSSRDYVRLAAYTDRRVVSVISPTPNAVLRRAA